mmetsp:Transcript_26974/g.57751  ORF Transcript_26974/g.57751 Transcript_26974/m.57751 type:complete len:100 (-) Transcript_26974:1273-1572(-)
MTLPVNNQKGSIDPQNVGENFKTSSFNDVFVYVVDCFSISKGEVFGTIGIVIKFRAVSEFGVPTIAYFAKIAGPFVVFQVFLGTFQQQKSCYHPLKKYQ